MIPLLLPLSSNPLCSRNYSTPSAATGCFQAWYFLQGASGVFLLPYLNIYLSQRGLSSSQIGLLAALRPWISAPLGMAASAAADQRKAHNALLLTAIAAATALRASLPLSEGLVVIFAQLVVAEVMGAGASMIGDATVLSNCKTVSTRGEGVGAVPMLGSMGQSAESASGGGRVGMYGRVCT
jgi:hypothetical protein